MYIDIEGISQWIQIETDNPQNPILLIVHGGPGASTRFAAAAWQSWRQYFTLVHWDQRGTGRTFTKNGLETSAPMTFEQIVLDGIAVTDFLRNHLDHQRIFLLGHSWGAAISVHMVKRRPELFSACVTTGLLVNFQQNEKINYDRELTQARESHNQAAIDELTTIGPPPYTDINHLKILRDWADKLTQGTGDSPQPRVKPPADFSADDREAMFQGFLFSATSLFRDLNAVDLPSLEVDFEIPMYCIMGTHDQQTSIELAEKYFAKINAPQKKFVLFEGCHHFVHMNRPDDFLEVLVEILVR